MTQRLDENYRSLEYLQYPLQAFTSQVKFLAKERDRLCCPAIICCILHDICRTLDPHEDVRACVRDHWLISSKKWKTPSRNKGHSVRHHVTSCSKTIQGWCLFVSHGVEWLKNLALHTHTHVLYLLGVRRRLIWSYTHKTTLSLNSGKIPRN